MTGRELDETRHDPTGTFRNLPLLRENMQNSGAAFEFMNQPAVTAAFVRVNKRIRTVL